ncbi:unnamed protein product, partial [Musa banksii]
IRLLVLSRCFAFLRVPDEEKDTAFVGIVASPPSPLDACSWLAQNCKETGRSVLVMDQSTQPLQPVMGIVTGAAQIAYVAPAYQPASIVTGAPAAAGTLPTPPTSGFTTNQTQLASQHQVAYQQVQQFHHQQQQHQQQQLQAFWANQTLEIEQTSDFRNHSLPLARIKKIMKADEDVRMISSEAPVVFAKACELFILELTLRAWIHTEENKRRTLQKNDIAAAVTRTDIFDFLVDIVPRDELKDDGLGILRAALPTVATRSPTTFTDLILIIGHSKNTYIWTS